MRQIAGASSLETLNLSGAVGSGDFDAWLGLLKHSQATDFGDIIRLGSNFERLYRLFTQYYTYFYSIL